MFGGTFLQDIWAALLAASGVGGSDRERRLERFARRLFRRTFTLDEAEVIAEAVQAGGCRHTGENVYRIFLTKPTTEDFPCLELVPVKYREDLLAYGTSVYSLRGRQNVKSIESSGIGFIPPPLPTQTPTSSPTGQDGVSTSVPQRTLTSIAGSSFSKPKQTSTVPTPTASTFAASGSSGLQKGGKIGIGIAVPFAVLLLMLIIWLWASRRWEGRSTQYDDETLGQAATIPEAMSKEVSGVQKIQEVPGSDPGVGVLVSELPSAPTPHTIQNEIPHVKMASELPAAPPGFLTGATLPTTGLVAQAPSRISIEATQPGVTKPAPQIHRKPVDPAAVAIQPGLQVVEGNAQFHGTERERQIHELEEQEQAVVRRLVHISEVQRLEDEREAIQRQLANLRGG
ncbi:MAG: hypothetical protein M1840_009029 [Geoglossum simile]|nr:MAG: hypothetical protein M1840_009029 [Geoglossum simile]